MDLFIAPLINKIVTVYTVQTAIPVAPERFPMVYTGRLKAYDREQGVILLENEFFNRRVSTVFMLQHVINICEEPEVDQNSEEYKSMLKAAEEMRQQEVDRMAQELMPQAMEQAKQAAMAQIKKDYGVTLKSPGPASPDRGASG